MISVLFPSLRRLLAAVAVTAVAVGACGSDSLGNEEVSGDAPLSISIDEADDGSSGDAGDGPDDDASASGGDDGGSEAATDAAAESPSDGEPSPLIGGQIAPVGERSTWSGMIDGSIGFTMWLTQFEDLVRGELTYDSVGEPIVVHGQSSPSGDAWLVREFGSDGRVTGTLRLGSVVDGVVAEATWGDADLALTFDGIDTTPTFFDPLAREGHYEYAYAPFPGADECCGPTGSLRITEVTSDEVTFDIESLTGGPGYNLALVDPTTVPLDGNVARYELAGDGADCAFDLRIFDGYVHVNYVDDRFDCQFGNAAGVEGVYVLTEPYVAAESSPFADAVLTADDFGGLTLGLTWAELTDLFGVPAYDPATADEISPGCNYVRVPGDPRSPWMMMLGDGAQSVLSRIEPVRDDQRTDAGIGIGSSTADVLAAYPEVERTPHVYSGEGAEYLRVVDATDSDSTVLFETDINGTVTAVRNGYLDPIRWIEGCA